MDAGARAATKNFMTLAGDEVLAVRVGVSLLECRELVAARLKVRPEMVHLIEQQEGPVPDGPRYTAIVCATFKVLCSECQGRIECACEEEEKECQCKLPQRREDGSLLEEELCARCHERQEMKAHWCSSKYCTVCRDDWLWPEATTTRRSAKRRPSRRALPELSWEYEAP